MNSMAKLAVVSSKIESLEVDVYSNKSSLILFWLLVFHENSKTLGVSINEIARLLDLSLGLVHRVVKQLEYNGIIISKGFRTGKRFYLESPERLLLNWVREYNLIKKTRTKGFSFVHSPKEWNLEDWGLVPALHSAAGNFQLKSTNLRTKEFYLLNWDSLAKLTDRLDLKELDRGYEVLFIKPYYSELLLRLAENPQNDFLNKAYTLLTVLDLCHFPVRGVEQAQTLFRKTPYLKSICSWSKIEEAIG